MVISWLGEVEERLVSAMNINISNNINIRLCGIDEWFDCHPPGCGGFTWTDENYPGFPPPQDSRS